MPDEWQTGLQNWWFMLVYLWGDDLDQKMQNCPQNHNP